MKNVYLVVVLVIMFAGILPARSQEGTVADPLAPFTFLVGNWASQTERASLEEFWTTAAGGIMLGLNRSVEPGKRAFFEFLRIEVREDGVYYVAAPRGGAATSFKYVASKGEGIVFENLEHDFPQRIGYRMQGDQLVAYIEGQHNGQTRTSQWRWTRVR